MLWSFPYIDGNAALQSIWHSEPRGRQLSHLPPLAQEPQLTVTGGLTIRRHQDRWRPRPGWKVNSFRLDSSLRQISVYCTDLIEIVRGSNGVNCSFISRGLNNLINHRAPQILDLLAPPHNVVFQIHQLTD